MGKILVSFVTLLVLTGISAQVPSTPTSLSATFGTQALEPSPSDGIQYVSNNGNDANDGLSWGSAKYTIDAALYALPGGNASQRISGSGSVFIAGIVYPCADNHQDGLWLLDYADPQYNNPPQCWVRMYDHVTTALRIVGVGTTQQGAPNSHSARAGIMQDHGIEGDPYHPALWISGNNIPLNIDNLTNYGPGVGNRALVIGECSPNGTMHDRSGTCGASGIKLNNDSFNANGIAGSGPSWDITGQSFWIFVDHGGAGGTAFENGPDADISAAILIDGRGNSGNGLIFLEHMQLAGGGIKYYDGQNGGGLTVTNATMEGDFGQHPCPALVWIASGGGYSMFDLAGLSVADCGWTPAVRNDTAPAGSVHVRDSFASDPVHGNVQGPATVETNYPATESQHSLSMISQYQVGFTGTYVVGQTDIANRLGAPVSVRYPNLISVDPHSWFYSNYYGSSETFGMKDPYGGTNAVHMQSGQGGQEAAYPLYFNSINYSVGDALIVKVAARTEASGGGFSGSPNVVTNGVGFEGGTGYTNYGCRGGQLSGQGEWQWHYCMSIVTAAGAHNTLFGMNFDGNHPTTVAYPVFIIVPAADGLSLNELWELADKLTPYSNLCSVGQLCGPTGPVPTSIGAYTGTAAVGGCTLTFSGGLVTGKSGSC